LEALEVAIGEHGTSITAREILSPICCILLCFHCQNPGVFSDSDTVEARTSKATLVGLCRISKRMCAIVRPIFFQHYATRDLPQEIRTSFSDDSSVYPSEDDKFLIQRPVLMDCVQALQLQKSDILHNYIPALILLFNKASKELNIEPSPSSHWE
jgi:hypothetical protein